MSSVYKGDHKENNYFNFFEKEKGMPLVQSNAKSNPKQAGCWWVVGCKAPWSVEWNTPTPPVGQSSPSENVTLKND